MPLFGYNRDIPDGPHNPSSDQPLMKENTNSIDDLIDVDHFSFDEANGGLHRQARFVNEAAPGLGTANGGLYANLANGNSWPFWQNAIGTASQIISQVPTLTTIGNSTGYVTSLPGGLKVAVGANTNVIDGSSISILTTFTTIYSIVMTALGNSSSGTDRALVAQPRSVNAGAGTAVINLQDVNNTDETVAHTIYFFIVGI